MAGVLMTMLDKGVRLHPDSYSIVISKANQVQCSKFVLSFAWVLLLFAAVSA